MRLPASFLFLPPDSLYVCTILKRRMQCPHAKKGCNRVFVLTSFLGLRRHSERCPFKGGIGYREAAIRTETGERKLPGSSDEQPGRGGFLVQQSPRDKSVDDEISHFQQMTTGKGCPVEKEGIKTRTAEAADILNMPANAETAEIRAPGTETMMLSRKQASETSRKKESTVGSLAFYLLA